MTGLWRTSRKRSPRRPPIATTLLALASTTSALSLANFQLITSSAIPSPCIVAYNTQISGCSKSDFTNGNQCSSLCINGLLQEAKIVNAICGGLNVNSQSLLGLTLDGKLLDTLCPGANTRTTTVQVTVQPSTSSKAAVTTTSAQTSITTSSDTASTTTIDSDGDPTTTDSGFINAPSQTSTSTRSSTTSQSTQTAASTSAAQQAEATKGGGSPFDVVIQNQAHTLESPRITQPFLAVLAFVLLAL